MQPTIADAAAVLANYPPDCRPTSIEPLGSAGGMSGAQFWRIAAPRGVVALRRWPIEHPTPDRLRFIHAVLKHGAAQGCGVLPLPATTRSGETFVSYSDHFWELAPWMPGAADYERAPSIVKLRAAMHALAEFHCSVADYASPLAPGSAGGSNAVQRHLALLHDLSPLAVEELASSVVDTMWPELAPLAPEFVGHLSVAVPRAIAQLRPLSNTQLRLQPCLKDIWHEHVLFIGDRVTGIVDFGAIDFDTPATDIARLLSSLASLTPLPVREGQGEGSISVLSTSQIWSEGLAAYGEVRQLSLDEIAAARALEVSGAILAGCNWIRWIYTDGRQFENQSRIVERFKRIVARVAVF